MKNVLKSFAAFIFAALAISSCANSELVPETPKGPTHTVKFTSGVPETKTNMDIDPDSKAVTYTWTDDDLNRLTVYEDGVEGTIDTEKSTISPTNLVIYATFEGEPTDDAKEYTAVLNGVVENQTPRVDENSYDEEADVLVAKPITATAAEGIEFQFRRVVAVNKMNLLDLPAGETVSAVTITSDKPISGIIDGNDWSEDLLENTIVLTVNEEIPSNGKLTLYYMAIPVEDAILTVEATIGTDTYLKKFDKTLTTEAGNVKGYSVGLKKMESKSYTIEFNSKASGVTGITKSTKASTFIVEGTEYVEESPVGEDVSKCFYGGDKTNGLPLRVGASSDPGTITLKLSDLGKINATKITISAKQYNSDKPKKIGVNGLTKLQPGADYTNLTFNLDGSKISEIKLDSDGYIYVKSITVESYGEAEPAINANDISDVVAAGVAGATFNFSVVNIIGAPTATPDGVIVTEASVNGNTVTYTVSENETYAPREGSIIIKVGEESKTVLVSQLGKVPDYEGEGTLESPYTVADALLKIETLEPDTESEEVYVAGPIKSITTTSDNFKNGQITYVIGTDDSNIQIYCGKDFGGEQFASVEDIAVGQNVVVKGKLALYQSTKEMKANSHLTKVNEYDYVLKSIAVTGAKTLFDEGEEFSKGDAVVTASYRGNKADTPVTASAGFAGYESTVGTHEITVSYKENDITKTTTYDVTVADATRYGITVNQTGIGSGTVDVKVNESEANEARFGASIEVTVTPNAKNHVEAFSITGLEGDEALADGKYSFTMPANAVTINVQFEPNPTLPNGTILWSYDFSTTYAYQGATVTYSYGGSSSSQNDNLAGGTAPEYLIGKSTGSMTISGIPTGDATSMTLTFLSNHADYLKVQVTGLDGATSEDIAKVTGKTQSEWKIVVPENTEKFNIVITNTQSSNARIDNLELVVGAPKSAQTISFNKESESITLGDTYQIGGTYSILTATRSVGDGAVSYSVTEGDDVVSVNSSTGEVTIIKAGTAIITATAAETATYKEASASYTLTINEAGSSTTITETLNIGVYASANSWTNSKAYTTAKTDNVTFTGSGTGNNCKYYSSDESWRFYKDNNGAIKVQVPTGKKITKVVFTGGTYFTTAPTGWSYNNSEFTPKDGTTADNVTFSNENGTSQVKEIAVTYE